MLNRLLDVVARFVTQRRGAALGIIACVTLIAATFVPSLVAEPAPQRLTASSVTDQARVSTTFNQTFGNPDHIIVLLVQAEDVLAPEPLAYVHRLATSLREREYVRRVEGITVTPMAVSAEPPADDDITLDDFDDDDDELGEETSAGEPELDPELEEALGALVRAAPERFPLGLGTVGNRLSAFRYGPLVGGDVPTEEERRTIVAAIDDAPLVRGRLISERRRLTAVALFLDERVEDYGEMERAVRDVDAWLANNPPPEGAEVEIGGLPHLFHSIVVKMEQDNLRIIPLTLLVCFVLLFLSFRWLPGTFLPVVAVGVSALIVMGGMAAFGEPLDVITNIIPPLLIIIGVCDSIHLIGRYREELEHASTKLEAAHRTVRSMAVACFLTSITTSVGLASLVISQTSMLRRFGLIAAIGVLVAYLVTIVFLPAAMTGFRPPLPPRKKRGAPTADRGPLERAIVVLTRQILRRPWPFLGVATLVGLGCAWGVQYVSVDSALLDEFEEGDAAYTSTRLMEAELDGVRPLEILLIVEGEATLLEPEVLGAIDDTQTWLRGQPGVLSSLSVTDYLHESWARVAGDPAAREEPIASAEQAAALARLFAEVEPNPLHAYLAPDGRTARIQVRLADVGARASLGIIERLEDRLQARFAPLGVSVAMTGEAYTGSVGLDAVVQDLLGSLTMAVFIIFGMLVVLFGSFRLGILSIPPNVLPLVGTMAWMAWREIPLNAATVIVFSISLGLAVDGSIHLLARYREEIGRGIGRSPALMRAARGTGRAVVVSCVTLMLGFGVMLLSSFIPVRRFGELIAVTVAGCVFATLIVQPALLRIAAPKVPPHRFRRRPQPKAPS